MSKERNMRKFVLRVEYGTGKINMLTSNPDLIGALQEFVEEYKKALPDAKMYGLPTITKAEILPLAYIKEEENA
jgi:hypothetical protein